MSKRCDDYTNQELSYWLNLLRNGEPIHTKLDNLKLEHLNAELKFARDVSLWTSLKQKNGTTTTTSTAGTNELKQFEDTLLSANDHIHNTIPFELLKHHINLRRYNYTAALNNLMNAVKIMQQAKIHQDGGYGQELRSLIKVNQLGSTAILQMIASCPVLLQHHPILDKGYDFINGEIVSTEKMYEDKFNRKINDFFTNQPNSDSIEAESSSSNLADKVKIQMLNILCSNSQANQGDVSNPYEWLMNKSNEIDKALREFIDQNDCSDEINEPKIISMLYCLAVLRQNLYALSLSRDRSIEESSPEINPDLHPAILREKIFHLKDYPNIQIHDDQVKISAKCLTQSKILGVVTNLRILCNRLLDKGSTHADRSILRTVDRYLSDDINVNFTHWYIKATQQCIKGHPRDTINLLVQAATEVFSGKETLPVTLCPLLNGFLKYIIDYHDHSSRNSLRKWPIECHVNVADSRTKQWLGDLAGTEITKDVILCRRWFDALSTGLNNTSTEDSETRAALQLGLLRLGVIINKDSSTLQLEDIGRNEANDKLKLIQHCMSLCLSESVDALSDFNGNQSMQLDPEIFMLDPEKIEEDLDWSKISQLRIQHLKLGFNPLANAIRRKCRKLRAKRRPKGFIEGFDRGQLDPNRWLKKEKMRQTKKNRKGKNQKVKVTSGIGFQGAEVSGDIECDLTEDKNSKTERNTQNRRTNKRSGRRR